MKVETRMDIERVMKIVNRQQRVTLGRAGAYVRTVMRNKIGRKKKKRAAGKPMTSSTGLATKSIVFSVDSKRETVQIGPLRRILGPIGHVHEFGGEFRGRSYPARPFAAPSLVASQSKVTEFFKGTIKE